MKSVVFLVVLLVATASGHAQAKLADLSVMAGCWELRDDSKNLLISEQWMSPAGTSILGMGRTVKGGKTTDWEFMRVEQRQDGLFFVARPKANSEETAFKLISSLRGRRIRKQTARFSAKSDLHRDGLDSDRPRRRRIRRKIEGLRFPDEERKVPVTQHSCFQSNV